MGLFNHNKTNEYNTTTTGGVGHHQPHHGTAATGTNPYSSGNPTLGNPTTTHNTGPLGHHTGHGVSGTGPAPTSGGLASGTTTTTGTGIHAAPVPGHGHVNTGPAPLHGVNSGTIPSEKEALKLEKKGLREEKLGNLLHSSNMKEKGATHLAQADHLKMQASELSEAERLEHEAGMRRQRAVGLGADPMHAHGTTGHGPRHI
ncbi:uncharacterized protein L201_005810 [Kwoniella dendrophila CBS 6074]|uniref:Uncharacterized protein n=1 Tax=Kwoniella dendrophila CBS 6074 TaxID=1295534 RepID=A0AAX4K1D0_9TREE